MRQHPAEVRAEAKALVVGERMTYAEAARVLKVPKSTIEKWGHREGWAAEKDVELSYKAQVRALKRHALQAVQEAIARKAGGNEIAQLIHAWRAMETAFPEKDYAAATEDPRMLMTMGLAAGEALVEFLRKHNPAGLKAIEHSIGPFFAHLEATYA